MTHPVSNIDHALKCWEQGLHEEAIGSLSTATTQSDIAARAWSLKAFFLRKLSRYGEALAAAMQAIRLDPALSDAWESLGILLLSHKKWGEAQQALALAVNMHGKHPVLLAYYALALTKTGALNLAYQQVKKALQIDPNNAEALLAHVEILSDGGYYDLVLRESAKLDRHKLGETVAFCQGSAAFLTGDWDRGMRLLATVINSGWKGQDLPEWRGALEPCQSVVLYGGQGLGDTLQFIRYVDVALEKVGRAIVSLPRSLRRLIQDSFPTLEMVTGGEAVDEATSSGFANISLRCSFPTLSVNAEGSFSPDANKVPYLHARAELREVWRERLRSMPYPRIGIIWSSPFVMNSPARAIDLNILKPLLDVAKGHWVSLQLGPEAAQAVDAGIFDASPYIQDFADSAALMAELDLVISLDSAPAHLAGGLGVPVWVFLSFNADWRWLIEREDSIWYPTMRLFRQRQPHNWREVVENMSVELKRLLSGNRDVLIPQVDDTQIYCRHPHAVTFSGLL